MASLGHNELTVEYHVHIWQVWYSSDMRVIKKSSRYFNKIKKFFDLNVEIKEPNLVTPTHDLSPKGKNLGMWPASDGYHVCAVLQTSPQLVYLAYYIANIVNVWGPTYTHICIVVL